MSYGGGKAIPEDGATKTWRVTSTDCALIGEQGGAVEQTWVVREIFVVRRLSAPRNGQLCQGQEMTHY